MEVKSRYTYQNPYEPAESFPSPETNACWLSDHDRFENFATSSQTLQTLLQGQQKAQKHQVCSIEEEKAEEENTLVDVEPGIKAKEEVNITNLVPELKNVFSIILDVYIKFGQADMEDNPMVITSGNDSWEEHAKDSYHKIDRAIDVRGKYTPDSTLKKIGAEIQKRLGTNYKVIVELFNRKRWYKDHIHVEYHGPSIAECETVNQPDESQSPYPPQSLV